MSVKPFVVLESFDLKITDLSDIAKIFATGISQRKCISLECGLQNGTLAVFVATQIFSDVTFMVPTAAYALIMYITGFAFVFILKNKV